MLLLGESEIEQSRDECGIYSSGKHDCDFRVAVLGAAVENALYASRDLPHALNEQFPDCDEHCFYGFWVLVESQLAEIDLVDLLFGPKCFSVSYVYGNERIRRQLEELLLFAGQPLSLIFHLPTFLVLLLSSVCIICLFGPLHFLKRRARQHQMILPHSDQQTTLSKIILHDEDLIPLHQNYSIITSDLPQSL